MNIDKNARNDARGSRAHVCLVIERRRLPVLCPKVGDARYEAEGPPGLIDRSSWPHQLRNRHRAVGKIVRRQGPGCRRIAANVKGRSYTAAQIFIKHGSRRHGGTVAHQFTPRS